MAACRKPRLVVVGNGMAGMRTIEELLKLAPDLYDITVFGAEPHPNYNRILLSPVLAGEQTLDDIVLNAARVVRARTASRCTPARRSTRIDRARRVVEPTTARAAPYDRLLLATGSNPFILPIPGADLPGVLTYRDIDDTEAMIDAAASTRNAVVIGGGLLGLEAANGLKRARHGRDRRAPHAVADGAPARPDAPPTCCRRRSKRKGLAFRLEAQTEALVAGEIGPRRRGAPEGRRNAARATSS